MQYCPFVEPLRYIALNNNQFADHRAIDGSKCLRCQSINNTFQPSVILHRWHSFQSCHRCVESGVDVQGRLKRKISHQLFIHFQGIMVTPPGRLPSLQYCPWCSCIEGKSRDANASFMSELRLACGWKRPAVFCNIDRVNHPFRLFDNRACVRYIDAPRRTPVKTLSCDHQASGPDFYRERRSTITTRCNLDDRQIFFIVFHCFGHQILSSTLE